MRTDRDFVRTGASTAIGDEGMAATSHPAATLAAVEILRAGGNAVDGAIAAVAMQCVVDPLMTGIGGDCFALYAPKGGMPIALNGSGRTARAAEISWFRDQGIDVIHDRSVHAVTVPGAVDAWCRLSEDYGSLPLAVVLAPAIRAAETGYRVTPRVAHDWAANAGRLSHDDGAMSAFLIDGRAPRAGEKMAHPALGATLRQIGAAGRAGFYEGAAAAEIAALLGDRGGLLDRDDFAAHSSTYVTPISAAYRGYRLHECPPNGQGVTALIMLRILEGFDLAERAVDAATRIHLHAEAARIAYGMRDRLIGDPEVAPIDVEALLSEASIAPLRASIRLDRAGPLPAPRDETEHKDTVYLTVVDRDRNAISLINSIFWAFGSGHYAPQSGVVLQNRGASFRIDEDHPNAIGPRKRPMHTIIPAMLTKDDRLVMSFGVMGGQYQAAGHAHFVSEVIDRDKALQAASDAPRSFSFDGTLTLENTIDQATADALAAMGHDVVRSGDPIGGCQAIALDHETGALLGASDHRKDGIALGF